MRVWKLHDVLLPVWVLQRKQPSPAPAADKHPQEQQKSGAGAAEQAGKAAMAKAEAAGKAAQAAVASAGQAAKDAAHSVGNKVASTAAAAKEGLSGAKQQLHGATDAASDKARTWFDHVQVCMASCVVCIARA